MASRPDRIPDRASPGTLQARLKLRHLQALVTVGRQQSVQHSAASMSRTPSAISKSLSELEELLGQRLFQRTRRGLVPTPVGERLLNDAQRGLGLLFEALSRASADTGQDDERPVIRLGLLPTAAALAPAAIDAFRAHEPRYEVHVVGKRNTEMLAMLRARELDFIVGRLGEPEQMSGMTFEPFYEECTVCVVAPGHPLLDVPAPSLAQVCRYPVILPETGTVLRRTLDPLLVGSGGELPRVLEMMSGSFARAFMQGSQVVWFTAPGVIDLDVRHGWLVKLDIELPSTRRYVGMTARAGEPLPRAAEALAGEMRRLAAALRTRA